MNRCILKTPTVMYFPTLTGESCYLHFGHNTKFEYEDIGEKVTLTRKNMEFTILKADFERMFRII